MSEEIIKSKRMPGVLIAGLWLAVILVFVLSSVLSYQGMSQVLLYEEPGPMSSGISEINPVFFWAGRAAGVVVTMLLWLFFLRKALIQRVESKKILVLIFEVMIIVFICFISWFASSLAVFLTTGFVDIQPKWADNAFIVNIPVYVFGVLAMTDTFVLGTGKHFRASE